MGWKEDLNKPESEWCDYDWLAWYIRKQGYEPETTMENLCTMVFLHYEGELEGSGHSSFAGLEDRRPYPMCLMIDVNDVGAYVEASGGWKEFDYWA